MVTYLLGLASGLLAGVLGTWLAAALEPVSRWLARRSSRLGGRAGLRVHTETDPAIIWAGRPDWEGFQFYVPHGVPLGEPPANPREWHNWVEDLGGWDLGESVVRVTIEATAPVAVMLETPQVWAYEEPQPPGRTIVHPVGGAALQPRAFYADLDTFGLVSPIVTLADKDGTESLPYGFSLKKDEHEIFLIRVSRTTPSLVRWHARIPILVDGRREFINIGDDYDGFLFAGGVSDGPRLHWADGWKPF